MKFTITRETLLDPLQLVTGVVERRQTLPILSNLLLQADDGRLVITGSDQEVELRVIIEELEIDQAGEVTVPARKLMDICRSLAEQSRITLGQDGSRVAVVSGRFRSHLATLPAVDFPVVETEESDLSLEVDAKLLATLLEKTSFAMAQQDVRQFFNGILVELGEKLFRIVATNGQRLATSYGQHPGCEKQNQFIVPRKGVHELVRLLNDVSDQAVANLRFSPNHMSAEVANAALTTKLIDAVYPDYSQAIPNVHDKTLLGNRQEIKEALNRTSILSNEMYRDVRLLMSEGKLVIEANNPLQEEAHESVALDYQGDSLEIGFNVGYLLDALSAMQGVTVKMAFSDAKSACLLTDPGDPDTLFVVSPMML